MKHGVIRKRELNEKLVLERKMLDTHDLLMLDRDCCVGCSTCVKVCPREALKLSKALVRNGRLSMKGLIDIDCRKCTLCGECVVVCPVNAIKLLRNGKEIIPVIEAKAFPNLSKKITVNIEKCAPSCKIACKESCPTEAIKVNIEKAEDGSIARILEVNVEKGKCVFCGRCESACPQTAIQVMKPFQGLVQLNTDLCTENCQACVDICPSKALTICEDGTLRIEEQFCIYCGACQEVCPENAIEVKRTRVLHDQIMSGAWNTALEKLTSYPCLFKESNAKATRKVKEAVQKIDRF